MQNQEPAAAGTGIGRDRAHWEQEAANWVTWTRKPGHDPYWHYSPAFFQELVPPPGRATLEIGRGEPRRNLSAGERDRAALPRRRVGTAFTRRL